MSKKTDGYSELNGFLDKGTFVKGELTFQDAMRIDGKLEGLVKSDKTLIVGETGEIDGNIEAGTVIVGGLVKGTIHAKGKLEILSSGRVYCEITYTRLVVEDGAILEGKINKTGAKNTPAGSKKKED